jgi:hypothetical protein
LKRNEDAAAQLANFRRALRFSDRRGISDNGV